MSSDESSVYYSHISVFTNTNIHIYALINTCDISVQVNLDELYLSIKTATDHHTTFYTLPSASLQSKRNRNEANRVAVCTLSSRFELCKAN